MRWTEERELQTKDRREEIPEWESVPNKRQRNVRRKGGVKRRSA